MSVHPDLVQVYCKIVTHTTDERYEVYPNGAYVLSARLSPVGSTASFEVVLYTSPAPDTALDDEGKIPLSIDPTGRVDDYSALAATGGTALFFENGIYAACAAVTAGDDAELQVVFIPRKQYCAAFPYAEQTLIECWDEAHNKGVSQDSPDYVPIYTNFPDYERDNAEEDTGGTGGPGEAGSNGLPL